MKYGEQVTYWKEASFLARMLEWLFPSLRGRRIARSRAEIRRIAAFEERGKYR